MKRSELRKIIKEELQNEAKDRELFRVMLEYPLRDYKNGKLAMVNAMDKIVELAKKYYK